MQDLSGRPLQGRHGFVTGGGRGIGKAIALELARLGADVSVHGRDASVLGTTAREIESTHGVKTSAIVADLSRPEEIIRAIATAVEQRGSVSVLVNNAGIAYSAPFLKTGLDKWNEVLAIDLTSAFLCTQQVLKPMIADGFGRIVNVSSTSGLTGCS